MDFGSLGPNTQQLSMFGQASLRRVEDDIFFVHPAPPGVNGIPSEVLQNTPEGLDIFDLQFDFRFARHAIPRALAGYFRPQPSSVSITNVFESFCRVPPRPVHIPGSLRDPRAQKRLVNPDPQKRASVISEESAPDSIPAPPLARREPVERVLHGDRRVDHYDWLRHKEAPEVTAYLEAENAYTDAILKPTEAFQGKLYQEMLGRILQTDLTVPYRLRGYLYFTRTAEGKQYPYHYRRRDEEGSPEELLLDLNQLAEGHYFLGLGSFEVSDDNQLLAYSTDTTGFRQYTLHLKDLRTGEGLPLRIERVTSVAWAADNKTLFYTIEDETTKRSYRLYRHLLGSTDPEALLYEETDERFRIEIERTRSSGYLLLTSASHTTSEVRFLGADDPFSELQLLAAREDNHEYYADHHPGPVPGIDEEFFLIRTNSGGRTFRVVTVPVRNPGRESWQELIPNRAEVMLAGVTAFKSHVVLFEREGGLPYLRIVDLAANAGNALDASHRIAFAEPAYNASLGDNPEFDVSYVRFQYESFVTPRSVFDYGVRTRERILRKQQPVLGGYDASQYVSERQHATANDGTRVPISLVYRRDMPLDGSSPLLLYGYGSYGISVPVTFNSNRLSLLDRGVIYAVAHIRGGGELGKPWHDAGRMKQKQNTFTDFIAAAESLIAQRYTSPEKLAIQGGSAGGLLMGAVINLRPDLFRAVLSQVPFVDVLNTMLDASLPLTVGEYEEWGNPRIADDYFRMKRYCPYTNLERKAYPAMLLKTALNDSQVMYWEPAKYVAKLRTLKTDSNLLLLKTNMGAGHGGASGRYDYLREIALDYAFFLTQFGICA
jgi:oligopeptidase B